MIIIIIFANYIYLKLTGYKNFMTRTQPDNIKMTFLTYLSHTKIFISKLYFFCQKTNINILIQILIK